MLFVVFYSEFRPVLQYITQYSERKLFLLEESQDFVSLCIPVLTAPHAFAAM